MNINELENFFIKMAKKEKKAVFTKENLRKAFPNRSESDLSKTLSKAVKFDFLTRATKGIYIFNNTKIPRTKIGYDFVRAFRPNEINYLSLEMGATKWSVIPQIAVVMTIMTTGRSAKVDIPNYGRYYFTHTARDVRKDLEAGRIIVYDDLISLAKPDIVVRDLKRVGRSVELIDWESYEDAMEEAAAMPV